MTVTRRHGSATRHDARADEQTGGLGSGTISSAALEAVAALLDGECDMGRQLMLIATLRRDARIDLSDAEIKDLICEAFEEGWSPDATLTRLVALDDGSDGIRGVDCCPR